MMFRNCALAAVCAGLVLTIVRPDMIAIDQSATIRPPSGVRRRFKRSDLEDVPRRADRSPDGSYRAVAARARREG